MVRKPWYQPFVVLSIIIVIVAVLALIAWRSLRVSLTGSLPEGLYQVAATHDVERFDLVVFCPSSEMARIAGTILPEGGCASGRDPMLKVVVALGGDEVRLVGDALVVNGTALHGCGDRKKLDGLGHPVPTLPWREGKLRAGTMFVCGLSDKSWDSRYFGPVAIPSVLAKASPLVTRSWGWGRAIGWRTSYARDHTGEIKL